MTRSSRNWIWTATAGLAIAFMLALALHGERPEPGLGRFVASGPMARPLPSEVDTVDLTYGARAWQFRRTAAGSWQQTGGQVIAADMEALIRRGLDLLHNAAVERTLTTAEIGEVDAAQFELGDRALLVQVHGAGQAFGIRFGARNPLGLSRYVQIGAEPAISLLPDYVAEPWVKLAESAR